MIIDTTVEAAKQQEIDAPQGLTRLDGGLRYGGYAVVHKRNAIENANGFQAMLQRLEGI